MKHWADPFTTGPLYDRPLYDRLYDRVGQVGFDVALAFFTGGASSSATAAKYLPTFSKALQTVSKALKLGRQKPNKLKRVLEPDGTRDVPNAAKGGGRVLEFAGGRPQVFVDDLSHVTGRAAAARNGAIRASIAEDLPSLRLTHMPEYSPFINTGVAARGVKSFESRGALRNVIVHEELHHRWWSRGILDHHPVGSAKEAKFYETIRRYERMRGW